MNKSENTQKIENKDEEIPENPVFQPTIPDYTSIFWMLVLYSIPISFIYYIYKNRLYFKKDVYYFIAVCFITLIYLIFHLFFLIMLMM